jgi:hypothetical protein
MKFLRIYSILLILSVPAVICVMFIDLFVLYSLRDFLSATGLLLFALAIYRFNPHIKEEVDLILEEVKAKVSK